MRKYGVPTERFGEERSEECVDDEVEESVEEGIVEQAPSSAAITSRGRAFVRVVMAGVLADSCSECTPWGANGFVKRQIIQGIMEQLLRNAIHT